MVTPHHRRYSTNTERMAIWVGNWMAGWVKGRQMKEETRVCVHVHAHSLNREDPKNSVIVRCHRASM